MKFPWFRVYSRMVDDDKLKLLAFEDRWHFVALLCLKGEGLLDKAEKPDLLMRRVAVRMGLDTRALDEAARRLSEVGLIDRNTLIPLNWDSLQQRSDADSTAAERKRRQRQREREEYEAANKVNSAAQIAAAEDRNDEVTDMSRVTCHDVTRTEEDKEEDKELQLTKEALEGGQPEKKGPAAPPLAPAPQAPLPSPPPPPAAPPKQKEKLATRLPVDWVLPKNWGDWALEQFPLMTPEAVRAQAEVFADYWHAKGGQDARKLDWLATWRNWIRRANERMPGAARAGNAQQSTKYAGAAAAIYDGVDL